MVAVFSQRLNYNEVVLRVIYTTSLRLHNFFEVGISLKTVHVGGDHVVAEGVVSL